jgi:hypothetical protein
MTCRFEGCLREPERNGWCAGHRKQLQRGRALAPLAPRNTRERIRLEREKFEAACLRLEAAREALKDELSKRTSAYCNADSDDDTQYRAVLKRLWEAADDYARFRLVIDPFLPLKDRLVPAVSPLQRRMPHR